MASVVLERPLRCTAEHAWRLLRNFGAASKAFPDVLTESRAEGEERVVTFANGMVVRERLVTMDHERRRVAYAVVGGRFSQHAAAMQIIEMGGECLFHWVSDFLPDSFEPMVRGLMEQGAASFARVAEDG